jgi:hypothetical protein
LILFSYLFLSLKIFNQVQPQIIQVSFRYNQCNFFLSYSLKVHISCKVELKLPNILLKFMPYFSLIFVNWYDILTHFLMWRVQIPTSARNDRLYICMIVFWTWLPVLLQRYELWTSFQIDAWF